jgi:hypothetical protein
MFVRCRDSPPAAMKALSSSREPKRNVPSGVSASMDPSANIT